MVRQKVIVETDIVVWSADLPDAPRPPEPTPRDAVFSFNNGDVSKSEWDDFRSTIPLNSITGRPQPVDPGGNNYYTEAALDATYLNAVINNEVPTMTADGRLYFNVHRDSHNQHNMIRGRVPSEFLEVWYLKPQVEYRIDLEWSMADSVGWSNDPGGVLWAIIFQIWGAYSGAWGAGQHPVNPPFGLTYKRSGLSELTLVAQLYGTESPAATAWEYSKQFTTPISISGTHTATIWWKKDHRGNNSRCRVDVDGTTIGEVTNVKLGTPFAADGSVPVLQADRTGGLPSIGMYTRRDKPDPGYASPGVESYFSKYEIYRVD